MNAKISMFVICFEVIKYLLLYNLHDCTFKIQKKKLQEIGSNKQKTKKQNKQTMEHRK